MNISMYIIFGLIGLALVCVIWRFGSERYHLPCPSWLSWMLEIDNPFAKVAHAATIIQNANIQPGMRVVDIGCGLGRVTIPAAHSVGPQGHIVALDIQAGMLTKVKKKAEAAQLTNITYLQAGIGEGKLERGTFDRALLVTVLGEIPNQKPALEEIYHALKPGGLLSVTEIIFDPHFQRQSAVRQLAQEVGFQEKQMYGSWYAYTLIFNVPT